MIHAFYDGPWRRLGGVAVERRQHRPPRTRDAVRYLSSTGATTGVYVDTEARTAAEPSLYLRFWRYTGREPELSRMLREGDRLAHVAAQQGVFGERPARKRPV